MIVIQRHLFTLSISNSNAVNDSILQLIGDFELVFKELLVRLISISCMKQSTFNKGQYCTILKRTFHHLGFFLIINSICKETHQLALINQANGLVIEHIFLGTRYLDCEDCIRKDNIHHCMCFLPFQACHFGRDTSHPHL